MQRKVEEIEGFTCPNHAKRPPFPLVRHSLASSKASEFSIACGRLEERIVIPYAVPKPPSLTYNRQPSTEREMNTAGDVRAYRDLF